MSAPILVTGMPRSGTTWVAHMLAAGGETVYINEPLNPQHPPGGSPGILNARVEHRFHYICDDNDDRFLPAYRDLLRLRYHPLAEIRQNHTLADLPRQANYMRMFLEGRARHRRVLVADPYAVFSIPWLVRRLGFQVVVIVRHPAATVSSRKRLGWLFDVSELERQPLLARDVIAPLGLRMRTQRTERNEQIIDTGALLWTAIYAAVASYRGAGTGIHVVRHEDLSREPQAEFERLYSRLGLGFSQRAARAVEQATTAANPAELPLANPHEVKLDSRANLDNWQRRLTPDEIRRIEQLTGDVAAGYYPEG